MAMLLIINDKAGPFGAKTIEHAIQEAYVELHLFDTFGPIHVTCPETPTELHEYLVKHQEKVQKILVAGGDGTLMMVLGALYRLQWTVPVGILPVGTGNRLADNLGIPMHIKAALEVACLGDQYDLDLGAINDQFFVLMAGAGLDADIMHFVQPLEKKALGVFAYILEGVKRVFQTPYTTFDIEADGQYFRKRGIGVVIANAGNLLGPYVTLTPGARVDDGLLDICVLLSRHRFDYWSVLVQMLLQQSGSPQQTQGLFHVRASHIVIRSRPIVRAQADGDVIGQTPLVIKTIPSAVQVMIPKNRALMDKMVDPLLAVSQRITLTIQEIGWQWIQQILKL